MKTKIKKLVGRVIPVIVAICIVAITVVPVFAKNVLRFPYERTKIADDLYDYRVDLDSITKGVRFVSGLSGYDSGDYRLGSFQIPTGVSMLEMISQVGDPENPMMSLDTIFPVSSVILNYSVHFNLYEPFEPTSGMNWVYLDYYNSNNELIPTPSPSINAKIVYEDNGTFNCGFEVDVSTFPENTVYFTIRFQNMSMSNTATNFIVDDVSCYLNMIVTADQLELFELKLEQVMMDNLDNQVNDSVNSLDNASDALQVDKPNVDDIDINVNQILPAEGMIVMYPVLTHLTNSPIGLSMVTMVAVMMMLGYVFFGKKG